MEDDPVVDTYDVVINNDASDVLYSLHYPIKPRDRPPPTPSEALLRYENEDLKLTYQLDTASEHYDEGAPSSRRVDRNIVSSTPMAMKVHHVVGRARDGLFFPLVFPGSQTWVSTGVITLTPLRAVYHMKPELEHLNVADDEDMQEEQGEGKQRVKLQSRVQKVTVSQGPKKIPYSAIASLKEKEKPVQLVVHDEESPLYATKLEHLSAKSTAPVSKEYYLPQHEFLNSFNPAANISGQEGEGLTGSSVARSLAQLQAPDQVQEILKRAVIVKFSTACEMATKAAGTAHVLSLLQQYARCIRGYWTLRSKYSSWCLPGPETKDLTRGQLIVIRDYILSCLAVAGGINLNWIAKATDLPRGYCKSLLLQVGKLNIPAQKFEFRFPTDASFAKAHGAILKEQTEWWKSRHRQLQPLFRSDAFDRAVDPADVPPQNIRTITEEAKDENMSAIVMDDEGAATIKNLVEGALRKHGVLTLESMAQALVPSKTEKGVQAVFKSDDPRGTLWKCIKDRVRQVAPNKDLYILKVPVEDQLGKQRDAILELLLSRDQIRRVDVAKHLEELGLEPLSGPQFMNLMREIAVTHRGAWSLKQGSLEQQQAE